MRFFDVAAGRGGAFRTSKRVASRRARRTRTAWREARERAHPSRDRRRARACPPEWRQEKSQKNFGVRGCLLLTHVFASHPPRRENAEHARARRARRFVNVSFAPTPIRNHAPRTPPLEGVCTELGHGSGRRQRHGAASCGERVPPPPLAAHPPTDNAVGAPWDPCSAKPPIWRRHGVCDARASAAPGPAARERLTYMVPRTYASSAASKESP